MTLVPGFTCSEASPADQPELWEMFTKAYAKDEHWKYIMENIVEPVKILPWILETFSPRWLMPDVNIFKVTENESGKIVAWTGLQTPWKYRNSMTAELKEKASSEELPPILEGMNTEALQELFKALGGSHQLDYNPESDYHRKGTFVHPDFQKRGFGTHLTKICNGIADKSGDRTWVTARPTSHHMFLSLGFEDKLVIDCKLERWGGSREGSMNWVTVRNPPGK